MTVRITPNLNRRIQLLREQRNIIEVTLANGKRLPPMLLQTYQQDLKVCKELLKQELIKAPINNI